MKGFIYLSLLFTFTIFFSSSIAQLDSVWHQGPLQGSLSSGVEVTLNPTLTSEPIKSGNIIADRFKIEPNFGEMIMDFEGVELPEYHYVEDPNAGNRPVGNGGETILLQKYPALGMTNSIPPDPHLAVGPNHVLACVNSRFAVWDKEGNQIANVDADSWISPVIGAGAFDPQIMYDHYEGRWFMLWDWQNSGTQQAYFVISYTDDDDPMGTWYMYLMDAKKNGTQNTNTWGDFPQIGYDDEAIYINSRSFTFSGSYLYNRIRILNKAELYASNGGALTWMDIWSIRTPGQGPGGQALDVIHPVYSYTAGSGAWFFWANRSGGNSYVVYTILNPISAAPRIRGSILPVTFYGQTPNANQLGGGNPRIEANGSHVKNQPVLRDGLIYVAHSIRNTTSAGYASAKYFIYEISSNSIIEQAELGAQGFFYIYPTLTVDQDHNIAMTFSRSADTEYIGAFYSSKQAADPPGLNPSLPIQEGLGNYVVTFGGSRNRWGDYLGICIDPSDFYSSWLLSEYAADTNEWGTYIAEVRMEAFPGVHAFAIPETIDFGDVELDSTSIVFSSIIANYGEDELIITDLPQTVGDFTLETSVTLPDTLMPYDSLMLEFTFSPTLLGNVIETYIITNNDPNFTGLTFEGNGYKINPAFDKTFYASSGSQNNGEILTIEGTTGAGTLIGPSLFEEVKSLSIHPNTGTVYGLVSRSNDAEIVRVNAIDGDSYNLFDLDLPLMASIAFDGAGTLYGILRTGELYTINLDDGTYSSVVEAEGSYSGIAFHPSTNELWASAFAVIGSNIDAIFKVDIITGDTTIIGHTGFGKITNDIVFDENSNLYGVVGTLNEINDFINIDVANGTGSIIGSVGFQHILGLAYEETGVVSVENDSKESLPTEFSLKQNYPNPFNPTTIITYSLPEKSNVIIRIYNSLGAEVGEVVNSEKSAGIHNVEFDASGLSSGVYFYRIQAGNFLATKKMVVLK